jgi:NTP pyrophosphatase (non-canonical NTP hydrolase)
VLDDLVRQIVAFRDERDWKQFHSPKNLAASICIEAAELLECFQWSSDATLEDDVRERRQEIEDEIADVLIYTLLLAHDLDVDVNSAVTQKLSKNASRYPSSLVRGSSRKAGTT